MGRENACLPSACGETETTLLTWMPMFGRCVGAVCLLIDTGVLIWLPIAAP